MNSVALLAFNIYQKAMPTWYKLVSFVKNRFTAFLSVTKFGELKSYVSRKTFPVVGKWASSPSAIYDVSDSSFLDAEIGKTALDPKQTA